MTVYFKLVLIVVFVSISGKSERKFTEGTAFKALDADDPSSPGTWREVCDLYLCIRLL